MLEILSNTQDQQLTTSDNGRNLRPALVANSHFYIESSGDGAFSQSINEKFGPLSTSQFRTTAKVTLSGITKVYAVCQGQVFIQPQTGSSDKVNLILRPYKQPVRELPIKYFIYRGLNKSDFVSGVGNLAEVTGSETNGSEFIQHIWGEFNKFYVNEESSEPQPSFLAKMIGFSDDSNIPLDRLIDEYFYKISIYDDPDQQNESDATQFELPLISKGMWLGNANGDIGLDIVLNKGDYYIENDTDPFQLNLAFAREADHVLDTSVIVDTSQQGDFQKKLIKEACTQFMDVAAFYGLHCNGQGNLSVTNVSTITNHTNKNDIYNYIKDFATKHSQYLYIQSNRQRSYNFYDNYQFSDTYINNFKIGADENNLNEIVFGTQGWPIHIINESTFTLKLIIDTSVEGNMLYITTGGFNTEVQRIYRQKELISDTGSVSDIDYTNPIGFNLNSTDSSLSIANMLQMIYIGSELDFSPFDNDPFYDEYRTYKLTKELFISPKSKKFIKGDFDLNVITSYNLSLLKKEYDVLIDRELPECTVLRRVVFEESTKLIDATNPDLGTVSKNRVLFMGHVNNFSDSHEYRSLNLNYNSGISQEALNILYFTSIYGSSYSLNHYDVHENGQPFKVFLLQDKFGINDDYFHIGITQEELDGLISYLPNNSVNVSLFLHKTLPDFPNDGINNVAIIKYALGFIYEDDAGTLQKLIPSLEVFVYGIRLNYLTSKAYAEFDTKSNLKAIL